MFLSVIPALCNVSGKTESVVFANLNVLKLCLSIIGILMFKNLCSVTLTLLLIVYNMWSYDENIVYSIMSYMFSILDKTTILLLRFCILDRICAGK